MKVSDFNYNLPEKLIAQTPIENRDTSRLMVLDRKNKTIENKIFKDIINYLQPGDCLVRNNTKVIPARIYGIKEETGIQVEFLLLNRLQQSEKLETEGESKSLKLEVDKQSETNKLEVKNKKEEVWEVMVRPRKAFKTRNYSKLWKWFIKSANFRNNEWRKQKSKI